MRCLPAVALLALLTVGACRQQSSPSSPIAAECAALQRLSAQLKADEARINRMPVKSVDQLYALLREVTKLADSAIASLNAIQTEDSELAGLLVEEKDALYVLRAMVQSTETNLRGGFVDSMQAQLKEFDRYMKTVDGIDRRLAAQCAR